MYPLYDDNSNDDDFLDWLIDELSSIQDDIDKLPKTRTIFSDKQVMSVEDLIVGDTYTEWCVGQPVRFRLMSLPILAGDKADDWYVLVEYTANENKYNSVEMSYLCDLGIIPYASGGWHDTNYTTIGEAE